MLFSLYQKVENVNSRESLAEFVDSMKVDFIKNPENWENSDMESFLEAMSAWIKDMDGYYENNGNALNELTWKTFADILIASISYE